MFCILTVFINLIKNIVKVNSVVHVEISTPQETTSLLRPWLVHITEVYTLSFSFASTWNIPQFHECCSVSASSCLDVLYALMIHQSDLKVVISRQIATLKRGKSHPDVRNFPRTLTINACFSYDCPYP